MPAAYCASQRVAECVNETIPSLRIVARARSPTDAGRYAAVTAAGLLSCSDPGQPVEPGELRRHAWPQGLYELACAFCTQAVLSIADETLMSSTTPTTPITAITATSARRCARTAGRDGAAVRPLLDVGCIRLGVTVDLGRIPLGFELLSGSGSVLGLRRQQVVLDGRVGRRKSSLLLAHAAPLSMSRPLSATAYPRTTPSVWPRIHPVTERTGQWPHPGNKRSLDREAAHEVAELTELSGRANDRLGAEKRTRVDTPRGSLTSRSTSIRSRTRAVRS